MNYFSIGLNGGTHDVTTEGRHEQVCSVVQNLKVTQAETQATVSLPLVLFNNR